MKQSKQIPKLIFVETNRLLFCNIAFTLMSMILICQSKCIFQYDFVSFYQNQGRVFFSNYNNRLQQGLGPQIGIKYPCNRLNMKQTNVPISWSLTFLIIFYSWS
ncbi:hypothetical protein Hdeb2414_s0396g00884991 [Helianthus debilis subsp. tardiflorus]